ncbi:MAG: GIY-YIG nuclease family protein [Coprobacter sp.]|nr:GIY-YIG nuclease family protein [Coprobacter sp.]
METNTNYIISLQDILKGRCEDFDKTPAKAIKMVRHADSRLNKNDDLAKKLRIGGQEPPKEITNVYDLFIYRKDLFLAYQSEQKKGRFDGIDYMIVFLGEAGTSARFLGVYKICGRRPNPVNNEEEILDLVPVPEFQYLEEKIIIDWGKSTVSWHQYYTQTKYVIRIDEGMYKVDGTPVFKGYPDVLLSYRQLCLVLKDSDWMNRLKAVNCIYLIVDKNNGKDYVGSTYGNERIFGRWSEYAQTGHGGNVSLKEKVDEDPQYHIHHFQWSILEILSSNVTQLEAVERESLWKRKLMSIKHGYNNN